MRRARLLLVVLVAAAAGLGVPTSAAGEPVRAKLRCVTGVVGVDSAGHVRVDSVRNDRVTESRRSSATLPASVTAWGLYDSQDTKDGQILRLDAVTADGTPRRVTLDVTNGRVGVESNPYDQTGFTPRLFAGGYGFYAYTVNDAGQLQRWSLTRFGNGDLRFADEVTVGSGYADLTSLQASLSFTHKGVEREYLYATTIGGALKQIAVPVNKARKEKIRTLRPSGYEGVTELAWSTCNGNDQYASLIAVSPSTNTATWTTVKNSVTRPRTKLRGQVSGSADWNLAAVY